MDINFYLKNLVTVNHRPDASGWFKPKRESNRKNRFKRCLERFFMPIC